MTKSYFSNDTYYFGEIVMVMIKWKQDIVLSNLVSNRICNKILERDWFSARLFVT